MTDPALAALLEVQAHDTRLDQLRHQLETLPERTARDTARVDLAATEAALADRTATRDDLARQQKRIDDEVELLKDKRTGFDAKLYGGTVSNPRELQDLQEEIDALGRRIDQLEDGELEIMEQVEPVEAQLAQLAEARRAQEAGLEAAEQALTVAEAEVAAAIEAEEAAQATAGDPVPRRCWRSTASSEAGGAASPSLAWSGRSAAPATCRCRPWRPPACASSPRGRSRTARSAAGSWSPDGTPVLLWFAVTSVVLVAIVFKSPGIDYRTVAIGALLPCSKGSPAARRCCTR